MSASRKRPATEEVEGYVAKKPHMDVDVQVYGLNLDSNFFSFFRQRSTGRWLPFRSMHI